MAAPGGPGLPGGGSAAHRRADPAAGCVGAHACSAAGAPGPSRPRREGGMPVALA